MRDKDVVEYCTKEYYGKIPSVHSTASDYPGYQGHLCGGFLRAGCSSLCLCVRVSCWARNSLPSPFLLSFGTDLFKYHLSVKHLYNDRARLWDSHNHVKRWISGQHCHPNPWKLRDALCRPSYRWVALRNKNLSLRRDEI